MAGLRKAVGQCEYCGDEVELRRWFRPGVAKRHYPKFIGDLFLCPGAGSSPRGGAR